MNSLGRDGRTLILKGLDSPFKNVCIWACRKVAVNHITVGVPGLIRLLNSPHPEVAVQAAVALEEISHHYPRVSPSNSSSQSESYEQTKLESKSQPKSKHEHGADTESKFKPKSDYESRAESSIYSSKPGKVSVTRSVFPLPGEVDKGLVSGMTYYFGDLTPLKFMGITVALFACFYFSKDFLTHSTVSPNGSGSEKNAGRFFEEPKTNDGNRGASSIRFQDFERQRTSSKDSFLSNETMDMPDKSAELTGHRLPSANLSSSSSRILEPSDKRDELWLALALRYLEAGRPSECIKYCNRLIDKKRRIVEAKELKRLAQERYGMID